MTVSHVGMQTIKSEENNPQDVSAPRQFVALCGRVFRDTNPVYFPRTEHRGRTIYLCTESCLGAFLSDPDVFYKVHRNSEKGKSYKE